MDALTVLREQLGAAEMICRMYLDDLTDEEMLRRPCPGGNHIKWQVGHLILSEHRMVARAQAGTMPDLPAGFAERYCKEASANDSPDEFDSKGLLLEEMSRQRGGTLSLLDRLSESDLDRPSGLEYAPTVGSLIGMQAVHWLMHAGQWAVVRRQLGRAPLI